MFSRDYIFTVHFHYFSHAVCLPRILSGCHLLASPHHFPLIVFVILFSFYLPSAVLPDSDFKYRCVLLVACIAIFPFVFCSFILLCKKLYSSFLRQLSFPPLNYVSLCSVVSVCLLTGKDVFYSAGDAFLSILCDKWGEPLILAKSLIGIKLILLSRNVKKWLK